MPNHVTNILIASGRVLDALKSDEQDVDFNRIIPMPKAISETTSDHFERIVAFLSGKIELDHQKMNVNDRVKMANIINFIKEKKILSATDKQIANFFQMIRNVRKHSSTDWYQWSVENWGTKWNAYHIKLGNGKVQFQTAWCAPGKVIEALAAQFPDEHFELLYADEDIGSNCGHLVWKDEEWKEHDIFDPVDFALTVNGHPVGTDRKGYRYNDETGKWEYFEEEE